MRYKVRRFATLFTLQKELLGFSIIIYACRNGGNVSGNEYLRVWDNGTRNIKLNQARFLDKGSVSKDSALL